MLNPVWQYPPAADTALLIVDVQNDFCEGGSLPCPGGHELAHKISQLIPQYSTVIASYDWHIDPGDHFSYDPDYLSSWPPHCQAGTKGAELSSFLTPSAISAHFFKGHYSAAYSAYEGIYSSYPPPTISTETTINSETLTLSSWLQHNGITRVDIVGIAFDYCIAQTARDASEKGFYARVLTNYTLSIHPENNDSIATELRSYGIIVQDVL